MMKKRKLMAILLACSMSVFALGGCGESTENTESNVSVETETDHVEEEKVAPANGGESEMIDAAFYQNTTISGTVTKIDGNEITLQISRSPMGGREEKLEKPEGEFPEGEMPENMENGQTPPEMPEGQAPNGEMETKEAGENPREIPEGEALDGKMPENMEDAQTPPELPEGEFSDAQRPEGGMTDDTLVITISEDSDISLDDIREGDMVSVTFDEEGNVSELTKLEL